MRDPYLSARLTTVLRLMTSRTCARKRVTVWDPVGSGRPRFPPIEEQLSGGTGEGFEHSDAENAALLLLLKRLAADPAPSNPDAGIIALCDQVAAAWAEYRRLTDNIVAVSRSAQENGAAATQVLASAGELSQQAESLNREVSTFLHLVKTN